MISIELEGRLDPLRLDVPFMKAMEAMQNARASGWDFLVLEPDDRFTKVAVDMNHICVVEEIGEGIGA